VTSPRQFQILRSIGRALVLLLALSCVVGAEPLSLEKAPKVVLKGVPFYLKVKNAGAQEVELQWVSKQASGDGETSGVIKVPAQDSAKLELRTDREASTWEVSIDGQGQSLSASGSAMSGWLSLIPPLVAIGLALLTKQVLIALLVGIFSGALLLKGGLFQAFATTLDTFLVDSVIGNDHAFILLFTMALGGMVSLVSASGGMQGMVDRLSKAAKTPASTQLVTWLMGVAIFFDDYANTLLVGQTMKPVTDKQNISRAKLAYLVDSTAAPIASIALISTWIGYEMSLIEDGFKALSIDRNVYTVFLESIVHRYYAIFALAFVLAVAYFHRDFGPMLKAEREALAGRDPNRQRADTPLEDMANAPTWGRSMWDAIIPVGVVLFGTIGGLVYTGFADLGAYPTDGSAIQNIGTLISSGNSFKALLWAAAGGGLVAAIMSKLRYGVGVEKITDVYLKGVTHMMSACIVLILAWAIGDVCQSLYTGPYLVELASSRLSPQFLPTVTFLLSAAVAFSTGTSWGTMAIVMPLAIRLAYELPKEVALSAELSEVVLISTIAGVLAGSTFGDHCSPISDTTIMSSMASGCDHIEHVRTQIPYALVTAFLAIVIGSLPAAYGVNPWVLNLFGIGACFLVVRFVGKPVDVGKVGAS
jgi:Na+/H+ antiporter NhaC